MNMGDVDHERLIQRYVHYAASAGVLQDEINNMKRLLVSSMGAAAVECSQGVLGQYLINDAYKLRMHKMYATYMRGVKADFALHVRKAAAPLAELLARHPSLMLELQNGIKCIKRATVMDSHLERVLQQYFDGFSLPQEMKHRAHQYRVAPIQMQDCAGQLRALASGPVEAASHVETSMMQLVQWIQILGQVADAQLISNPADNGSTSSTLPNTAAAADNPQSTGPPQQPAGLLDRTERLANSLARLSLTVQRLNALPHSVHMALYAGRRSSDRMFLLLQNLYCARHLRGYAGTSSVYAVAMVDRLQDGLGVLTEDRPPQAVGPLVGTLAHEVVSITQQLLGSYDDKAGRLADGKGGPVCVTALLAHLLMLSACGGLGKATALADTFTTRNFLAVACAAEIPEDFRQDLQQRHKEVVPAGGRCFDLFRIWRLDSGNYSEVATMVMDAWRQRCKEAEQQGQSPPARPILMHSNLESVDEIEQVAQLPEDIRPAALGFGSLVDGFLPFDLPGGERAEIRMCSVVMKAVQARAERLGTPGQASAVKLGDDGTLGKVQVDPRISEAQRQAVLDRVEAMAGRVEGLNPCHISAVLAEAYHDVTRKGILQPADEPWPLLPAGSQSGPRPQQPADRSGPKGTASERRQPLSTGPKLAAHQREGWHQPLERCFLCVSS